MPPPAPHSPHPRPKQKALHGGGAGFSGGGADSIVVGLAHVQGDPSAVGSAALRVVSAGFTEAADGKRAVLSPHLALVADVAVSTPVRTSALEAVFDRCCNRRKEDAGVAGGGGKRGDGKGGVSLSMSASCSALEGGDGRWVGDCSCGAGGWSGGTITVGCRVQNHRRGQLAHMDSWIPFAESKNLGLAKAKATTDFR